MTPEQPAHPGGSPTPPPSGPNNPSPTAELTGLAAHLRRLAARVDDLDTRCDELTDQVLPQLAEHSTQVKQLIDAVTGDGAEPLDWAAMDAEQAATAWEALARWIEHTLVPWFEITRDQLPDCWALHRPAVIELAWLHRAHHTAHQPGAAPHLPTEWHTRWRPAVLRVVRDAIPRRGTRTCGPGRHLTNETERVQHHPSREQAVRLPTGPVSVPTEQLAERCYWQSFYEQAVGADLAIRRQRPAAPA